MSRLNKDTQPWVAREGCGFRFATGAGVTVVQMGGDGSCASKNEGGEVKVFMPIKWSPKATLSIGYLAGER
ncbi:hypothetical protein L1987_06249 [Smallanthus sonchifolius]|uniref:Uncharacterized protein n=1 Tax=Smallanthus sonchifolius TaxID=185202 RepID=A0ACB9JXU6_9ASTR|nr:hypothetical protein L1987_06249 [Smallanthus sonchifolius]